MTVAVVGGGIIGLAVAWRLARRGADVTVYDPGEDDGAWFVAAGMLAPGGEATFEHPALRVLLRAGAGRWPGFAADLAAETGHDLGYDRGGSLAVALTADDAAEARRNWVYQGLDPLLPTALREREPALSPRVRAGAFAADDHQVDPRRVVAALRATGVRVVGKRLTDLAEADADTVVVAAGCGTAALTGLPIRPVKGQLLRLRGEPRLLTHVVTGIADGRHVYLVPRADGEVVVGATQEELTDRTVTADAVHGLLRAAIDLVPALADFALTETLAAHRPATPDNAPVLGPLLEPFRYGAPHSTAATRAASDLVTPAGPAPGGPVGPAPGGPGGADRLTGSDGGVPADRFTGSHGGAPVEGRGAPPPRAGARRVIVAAGHHRNGVLLAPITADLIADLVLTGRSDPILEVFRPGRFPCV